jgi:lambda family phage portal protein
MWPLSLFRAPEPIAPLPAVPAPGRGRSAAGLQVRKYLAAEVDRLTGDWPTTLEPAAQALVRDLRNLRARSRFMAENDSYIKRWLQLLATNVVGPQGVRLQCQAKEADGSPDTWANDTLESGFKDWGRLGSCTVCGTLSWLDCQDLWLRTAARDGEVLVRVVENWPGNPYRLALQFIDVDHLPETLNQTLPNGNEIRLGIEYDKWGRPVYYYISRRHPTGLLGMEAAPRADDLQKIPAGEILHGFRADRLLQGRGVPWAHASLLRLKQLQGYETSEAVAARIGASKMGFYKTPTGEEWEGDDYDEQLEPTSEAMPGMFEQMPSGWEFETWDPNHPVAAYEPYVLAVLRGAAAGLGVSYVSLANDLRGVSYSSIRQGTLEERANYQMMQTWEIDHLCRPIFERWLGNALGLGVINLPLAKFDKFARAKWRPRGWPWVDPLKEVKANSEAVRNGMKTLQDVAGESRGDDVEDIFIQLENERNLAQAHGHELEILGLGGEDNASG